MRSALIPKAVLALAAMVVVAGCSTDENPITPEKMAQIRQKEQSQRGSFNPSMAGSPGQQAGAGNQRQNFNPSMSAPPGQTGK